MSPENWIGILVALASFCVSIMALYLTQLAPFQPLIATGVPAWRLESLASGPTPTLTIALPIVLSNRGARAGLVCDMLLKLRCAEQTCVLVPTFLLNAAQSVGGVAALDSVAKSGAPMFRPVVLTAHEQVGWIVVFLPEEQISLRPGHYRMTLAFRAVPAAPSHGCIPRLMEAIMRVIGVVEGATAVDIGSGGWLCQVIGSFEVTDDDISAMERDRHTLEKASDEIRAGRRQILKPRS